MRLWKNRPLFALACAFMGAALTGFFLIPSAKRIAFCLCVTAAVLCLTLGCLRLRRGRSPRLRFGGLLCLVAAVSLLQSSLAIDLRESRVAAFEGQTVTVEATVTDRRNSGGNMSTFTLKVTSVNGSAAHYNALLTCYYVSDLQPGYEITLTAEAVSLSEAAGDVYEEYTLLGDGIFGGLVSMSEEDCAIRSEHPATLSAKLARHRYRLSLDWEQLFGDKASGLPSALLLGERDHLTAEVRRDFARTGVSHILAISGLHMTLLFGLLALILKFCGLPPRVRAVILMLLSVGYLFYLGFPPSATRAVIMLGMTYLSCLCFVGADPLTSLGLAGIVILLFSPTSVADAGFWMSFSATLGLLTLATLLTSVKKREGRGLVKWAGGLLSGVAAVTFSLWVTAPVMGEMSLLSAPMTLLLTPLTALLLLLTPIAALTASTPLGPWVAEAVRTVSALMTDLCEFCAETSWTVVSLHHPAIPYIAAAMVLLTLLCLGLSLPRKSMVWIPMATGWLIIGLTLGIHSAATADELQVSYLIPSTTSEMVVVTRGREAVICEMSNGSRRSFLTAAEEASRRGATELSAVILTDYHSATSGALLQLFRRETVRALWMPKPTNKDDYYLMLSCLEAAALTDVPVTVYDHGKAMTLFGTAELTVERTEIKRSARPVLLISLKTPVEQTVICGRSILESDLAIPALLAMAESDRVILSNQGPVIKRPMGCTVAPDAEALYLANETVAAYLHPAHYPEDGVFIVIGQGRFNMKSEEDRP